MLLALWPPVPGAQAPDPYTGSWESVDQHFRLIIYQHQGARQILFYGQDETGAGTNRYVTRAAHVREQAGALLFELPAHAVYSNRSPDPAIAGHQSELPTNARIEKPSPWRLNTAGANLRLDCAVSDRTRCGLQRPIKLHTLDPGLPNSPSQ